MMASQDQNDYYPIGKSISDKSFSDDEDQSYERIHRNSADSSSSERTLFVPYLLQDAFESSIYDKPEVHICDCAKKFALKNTVINDKISEFQTEIIQNESLQEQSQPPQKSISLPQLQLQQQEPQSQPQSQKSHLPPNYNEVYLLFIFVSVISYAIGHFGFTSVWLMVILYQSVKWYINVTKDHQERVRWEVVREMSMDKMRRDNGESVEWLNYLLQQIWRTFDPSLLIGLRDTFEDVMARSAPSFIVATDIESFEIGIIAPRIENIKILPRCENQDDEDVVIGEATFSFRAPSSNMSRNDAPPHILAWIKTGISAVIPIKVEIIGFKASIHFEIKITGTSPFISTGRFGFLKTPLYETSIMPLIPMNIAQFPIIKEFIRNTLETVLKQFTYPHHIDLDLEQMLMGDDLLHDTQAIGIMRADIIEARNLTRADISGENDPYVISSLDPSPYMHTHSATRVIENCAKPVWRETFFHKVPELDMVDEHIKFRLKVMDWDRFTADDHIGSVWFDIKDAIGNGEREILIHDGWKKIKLNPDDTETQGELYFRLEYYPKLPNKVEVKPEQTSGIFGLKIHQAMNLQITTAPYIEETIMMSDNHYNASFPNPYAVVYINDSRVFRTRAKLNNVAPFWNASTEQFVRDWKNSIVRVVVKDQKDLEYDPVIGMVTLSMKELFEQNEKKEATKWFPLRYGVGCGKVRLSFLLKPVSMVLPPEEKGYDVGTLRVHSIVAEGLDNQYANRGVYLKLTIRNTEIEQETNVSNSFPPRWLEQNSSDNDDEKNNMEFAVFRRYRTSLIITVYRKGLLGIYYTVGTAEYWLRNIKDCCETEVEIPIFENLPKCFPASDTVESSQNTNESQSINLGIPRCESPVSDIQDPETSHLNEDFEVTAGSSHDSKLEEASEKVIGKAQSTDDPTEIIPPEEVGESSQNIQSDEKNDVSELNDPKPNPDSNNTNEKDNEIKEPEGSSDQSSPKPTKVSSEKSVHNTTEIPPASDPSIEKSTANVSEKAEKATTSEIPPNAPQESSAKTENITSDKPSASTSEIKGFLRLNVYFKPGLSLAHEQDVQRSLTGVNASILSQNPLEDIENQQRRLREQRQATDIYSDNYESEKQRRINKVHRRRTMRQLQWVKDLVKAKVISMSGKREWEDEEIIEHEV